MKRLAVAVLLLTIFAALTGCTYNDGRERIKGTWVVEGASMQGSEQSQPGGYVYMDFQKKGVMVMGTSEQGPMAVYDYLPHKQGQMRLMQKDSDEIQEWFFWFDGNYLILDTKPQATMDPSAEPTPEPTPDENGNTYLDNAMKLIPLKEYEEMYAKQKAE